MAAGFKPLTVADRAWFSWSGVGDQPRGTGGKLVEIRLRDGTVRTWSANILNWDHSPVAPSGDIVAYRLAESELSSHPGEACAQNFNALRADVDAAVEVSSLSRSGALPGLQIEMLDEEPVTLNLPTTGPYAGLARTLYAAFEQAASGKGKERHAVDGVAFEDQPMTTINRQLGSVDGFIYQAHKKSLEAKRLPDGRAQAELLGAINYLAGAHNALDTWAKKPA